MANIRLATTGDAAGNRGHLRTVLRGDRHLVRADGAELPRRWRGASPRSARTRPWIVLEDDGAVIGYAYASPHNERAAYRWSREHRHLHRPRHISAGRRARALYDVVRAAPRTSATTRRPRASRCRIPPASGCTPRLDSSPLACIVTSATRWAAGTTSGGIRRRYSRCRQRQRIRARFARSVDTPEWHDAVARGWRITGITKTNMANEYVIRSSFFAGGVVRFTASTPCSTAARSLWSKSTISDMQAAMAQRRITSRGIVQQYLDRIAKYEDRLNAIITLNPRALDEADARDRERAQGKVRGPLHGIPIALKDNIHTTDMPTTGGALAFKGFVPPYEADADEEPSRCGRDHHREDEHDGARKLDCDRDARQLQRARRLWIQSLRSTAGSARGYATMAGRR